ncbi:MAG TPA: alpha/beta fold hydrolase [Gemmatimonadaceae bacterium]
MTPGETFARESIRRDTFALPTGDGLVVRGDALLPPGATTAVVLCHGFLGFGRWAFFPYVAEKIAEAGMHAIAFDFSGSGIGPDRDSFTEPDAFEANTYTKELRDLALVEEEAHARGWLGETYGLFGHSRGGGIAVLHAARSPRVGALVTWASVALLGRWPAHEIPGWRERGWLEVKSTRAGDALRLGTGVLDELDRLGRTELDVLAAAGRLAIPWLIVHGTKDDKVPVDDARLLHDAAARTRPELLLVDDADHTFGAWHPLGVPTVALAEATRDTVAFLDGVLA